MIIISPFFSLDYYLALQGPVAYHSGLGVQLDIFGKMYRKIVSFYEMKAKTEFYLVQNSPLDPLLLRYWQGLFFMNLVESQTWIKGTSGARFAKAELTAEVSAPNIVGLETDAFTTTTTDLQIWLSPFYERQVEKVCLLPSL